MPNAKDGGNTAPILFDNCQKEVEVTENIVSGSAKQVAFWGEIYLTKKKTRPKTVELKIPVP